MAGSIWKGSINFGLVNFPVEMKAAVRSDHVSFHLLHGEDLSPVHYQRVDEQGEEVPWDEIVKGYEFQKGKYVVMTDEDFRAAALESSRAIEICDFVDEDEIDPRFFETPYFLVPGKGGEKGYVLLREAMAKSGKVGVGKVMIRQKQHLAGIKAVGDALVLELMRFASELVEPRTYKFPAASSVRPQEVKMAEQLIGTLAAPFHPEKYGDEYRENLMRIIRAKMEGKEIAAPEPAKEEETEIIDLMSRLRASLEAAEGRKGGGHKTAAKKSTAAKSAKSPAAKSSASKSASKPKGKSAAAHKKSA
ncbi:MAG TPA: Ku protein [Longimicrobiaceae bacterium]|jgi:DNA end-binding protein Ku|nr:Ku protein [Longimicrobiaceae bacterium]